MIDDGQGDWPVMITAAVSLICFAIILIFEE